MGTARSLTRDGRRRAKNATESPQASSVSRSASSKKTYKGRFAPSPTGPLHLGSLLAAVVSYLDARWHQGSWLVRIEDLDPPREQPGASQSILHSLEAHGLLWDEEIRYQSQRGDAYETALHHLAEQGQIFWCQCSRKQLGGAVVYPGYCRQYTHPRPNSAIRYRAPNTQISFEDRFQGPQSANLADDYGDVVIRRRDGLYAYQLAVTVDDLDQGITHVVRGTDLLSSTYWQQSLFHAFGAEPPNYAHFPVILGPDGHKLSKQNHAPAIDNKAPSINLQRIFGYLGFDIALDRPEIMLRQAIGFWPHHVLAGQSDIKQSD